MKTNTFLFKLTAVKMFQPELDKGEVNPYTTGDEIGNPYMKDIKLDIAEDDFPEVLELLERKGYDVSRFQ